MREVGGKLYELRGTDGREGGMKAMILAEGRKKKGGCGKRKQKCGKGGAQCVGEWLRFEECCNEMWEIILSGCSLRAVNYATV